MTKPRIEEMVEQAIIAVGRSGDVEGEIAKALTEAHQAGIDEANSDYKSLEASWMALKDDYSDMRR